jgi:hypothetical protein
MCCRSAPEKAANAHPNVLAASKRFSCNARVQQTLAQRKLHGVLVSSLASPSLLIAQRAGDGATSDLKDNQHWMVAQQDRSNDLRRRCRRSPGVLSLWNGGLIADLGRTVLSSLPASPSMSARRSMPDAQPMKKLRCMHLARPRSQGVAFALSRRAWLGAVRAPRAVGRRAALGCPEMSSPRGLAMAPNRAPTG